MQFDGHDAGGRRHSRVCVDIGRLVFHRHRSARALRLCEFRAVRLSGCNNYVRSAVIGRPHILRGFINTARRLERRRDGLDRRLDELCQRRASAEPLRRAASVLYQQHSYAVSVVDDESDVLSHPHYVTQRISVSISDFK